MLGDSTVACCHSRADAHIALGTSKMLHVGRLSAAVVIAQFVHTVNAALVCKRSHQGSPTLPALVGLHCRMHVVFTEGLSCLVAAIPSL
jgi:hypothetical protein